MAAKQMSARYSGDVPGRLLEPHVNHHSAHRVHFHSTGDRAMLALPTRPLHRFLLSELEACVLDELGFVAYSRRHLSPA